MLIFPLGCSCMGIASVTCMGMRRNHRVVQWQKSKSAHRKWRGKFDVLNPYQRAEFYTYILY
jgi:hypothetical protein